MLIKRKYWSIAKRLSRSQLQKESDNDRLFDDQDLFTVNIGKRGHSLFLGYYSRDGLKLAFEKYGILQELKEKGFDQIVWVVDTDDPYQHKLALYYKKQDPRYLLFEVILKKEITTVQMPFSCRYNGKRVELLSIEWMVMQNINGRFTKEKPRLPGQTYPGLGMASRAVELLLITAWRLQLAGLMNTPQNYHNAYLYSRIFYYLNPEYQAMLQAMKRDMKHYPLHIVAWALEWEAVYEEHTAQVVKWPAGKQIVPLEEGLKEMFESKAYRNYVKERSKSYRFILDEEKYQQKLQTIGG